MAINWGLIGLGILGQDLAAAFARCTTGRLVACAGRTHERSLESARSHGVERAYPSHEGLLADPAGEAVLVEGNSGELRGT